MKKLIFLLFAMVAFISCSSESTEMEVGYGSIHTETAEYRPTSVIGATYGPMMALLPHLNRVAIEYSIGDTIQLQVLLTVNTNSPYSYTYTDRHNSYSEDTDHSLHIVAYNIITKDSSMFINNKSGENSGEIITNIDQDDILHIRGVFTNYDGQDISVNLAIPMSEISEL